MGLSVIILTFNSADSIEATLSSVAPVSDDIHVVDSGSSDATLDIVARFTDKVTFHPFENYGAQRNWAISELSLQHVWQLHLDADERLSPELAAAIRDLLTRGFPGEAVGYFLPRLTWFLGRPIRHGAMYPIWHMRLFKTGHGRCEARKYDQHFLADGVTDRLHHPMIDDIRMPLTEWTARHNRWADAEADELQFPSAARDLVQANIGGDPTQQKRALRRGYNGAPLFLRALMLFVYRYVFRCGFLDGWEGLIFFVLQTFWFRFLVDAKIYESRAGVRRPLTSTT